MFCEFRNTERLAGMLEYVMIIVLAHAHFTDAACSFPTNLQNKNMTSTNFGTMLFQPTSVNFTIIVSGKTLNLWTCHATSGTKYVLKSESLLFSSALHLTRYLYYCLDIREQSSDSYLYYLQSDEPNSRLQTLASNVTVEEACNATKNTAEYNVMINSANSSSIKNYCASPLLGNFYYTCSSKNGTLNVCTNSSSQKTLIFNHTQCTGNPLYSVSGKLNCVATTSTIISSQTVYYQTLYNTDSTTNDLTTYPFVCVAASDTNGTVYMSYSPTVCTFDQTAKSGGTNFQPLSATETCPFVSQNGNGQVSDAATTTQKSVTSATSSPVTSTPGNTPSTTVATTLSPTCVQGTCTDQDVDDDYKCLAEINGTCPKTGGCETEVTKTTNTTQIFVSCVSSCPTVTTTTTSSKIITCCLENMCNQYQPPFSKAHYHSPNVMYYVGAFLFLTRQIF